MWHTIRLLSFLRVIIENAGHFVSPTLFVSSFLSMLNEATFTCFDQGRTKYFGYFNET